MMIKQSCLNLFLFVGLGALASTASAQTDSACQQVTDSGASDIKTSFICGNEALMQGFLNSPLVVFGYLFGVLMVMFLVWRSANGGRRQKPEDPKS